ncbi:hypothetical protein ACMGD3_08695 [Lysinibacillus sphaericus]|uniref:hypothetical protein n=1 Tax=Lysinibacillus sphaericus TaxID=1421 RepID=UPI003F79F523
MTHFEYTEQHEQMTIFDLEDQYEELQFRKLFTNVNKPVDKTKKPLKGPRLVGYIVRR